MDCPTREQIERYADGELSGEEKTVLEGHLASCPACRALRDMAEEFGEAMHACEHASPGDAGPCPDAETLAALMDGSIPEGEERARIAAHVAACGVCASAAAEAAEAARLAGALEEGGLEPPPLRVLRDARAALFGGGMPLLGEIAVSIAELLERFRRWSEGPAAASAFPCIAESRADTGYHLRPGATARPERAVMRDFSRGGLSVRLSLAAGASGAIECTVRLAAGNGKPLRSVPVEMRKGTATLHTEPTGRAGEAVFRGLVAGSYQFLIRRREGARVSVALN